MPTDVGFTGQRLDATGLMFYQARYFSPVIGRFVSADTIVPEPGNPQAWNRYAYVLNNPVKYTDSTGHDVDCGIGESGCRRRVEYEKSEALQRKYWGQTKAWDQLSREELKTLRKVGWDETTWNAEMVYGNAGDPGLMDPALLIPVGGGAKIGASIAAHIGEQVAFKAGVWCLTNPVCAALIFGVRNGGGTAPSRLIRFTQDSISPNTKTGVPLDVLSEEIANGKFQGTIRVVEYLETISKCTFA